MQEVKNQPSNSILATTQQLRRANTKTKKSTSALDTMTRLLPNPKNLVRVALLAPGLLKDALAAPVSYGHAARDTTYTVATGDSLSGIAAKEGVGLSALEAANPQVSDVNLILPGQVLTVPGIAAVATGTLSGAQAVAEVNQLQDEINSLQGEINSATSPAQVQSLQVKQSQAMASQNAVFADLNGQAAPSDPPAPVPAPALAALSSGPAPSAAPTPAPVAPQAQTSTAVAAPAQTSTAVAAPVQTSVASAAAAPASTAGASSGSAALSNNANGAPSKGSLSLTLADNAPQAIKQWANEINAAAKFFNVPAALIGAVMNQESSGKESAATTNPGNGLTDAGLMQVNPDTQAQVKSEFPAAFAGLSGAAENIMAGTAYLRDQYVAFGSWPKALRAYNSGPSDPSLTSGNLNAPALGDPTYITKVSAWWVALSTGQNLPSDYNPAEVQT